MVSEEEIIVKEQTRSVAGTAPAPVARAAAKPAPAPAPAPAAEELPATAGPLPLVGLLGALALVGAIGVNAVRRRMS